MKMDALTFARSLKTMDKLPSFVWIYGPETFLHQQVILALRAQYGASALSRIYGSKDFTSWAQLWAQASTPDLFSQAPAEMWVVKDVEAWKDFDLIPSEERTSRADWKKKPLFCFVSKHLDARKKEVKAFPKKGALVEASMIQEGHRSVWIQHFEKKFKVVLPESVRTEWIAMEPWSLDRLEREFEKWSCGWLLLSSDFESGSNLDKVIRSLFEGSLHEALSLIRPLSHDPSLYLPFLGLLAWHLRKKRPSAPIEAALLRLDQALKLSTLPSITLWQAFVLEVKAASSSQVSSK